MMSMTIPNTPPNTLAELGELNQFFVTAEATIKSGQSVDMRGIETRIASLCEAVQVAPADQQRNYLPELTTLLSLLDSCEMAIRMAQTTSEPTVSAHQEA